jgi:hypothetical protein
MTARFDSDGSAMSTVFCTELERLHLMAYILTGSLEAAGECVVSASRDVEGSFLASPAFAYDTAKLATIKLALRSVADEIREHALRDSPNHHPRIGPGDCDLSTNSGKRFLAAILQLNAFYRAVLLLRIYEGYRNHVAALLLRLPPVVVERGKEQAIVSLVRQIHGIDGFYKNGTAAHDIHHRLSGRER